MLRFSGLTQKIRSGQSNNQQLGNLFYYNFYRRMEGKRFILVKKEIVSMISKDLDLI